MAGIFQGDALIRTAIELGMDDMRKNPWLIRNVFSDLINIKYVADKYGKAQVDAAVEWFQNNNIDIYMRDIRDKDRLPCVTIGVDNSNEKPDMKFMADQSSESIVLLPQEIGKPIPYILKPFIPTGYEPSTGAVSIPVDLPLQFVTPGMILVNPDNGQGFPIQSIEPETIFIEPNLIFEASQLGVLPHYRFYKARVEHTFFQESYAIGCHVHGEPQAAIWLHSIVLYSLLRYRESLLEANGFAESVVSNSPLVPNTNYTGPGGEEAWMRKITLSGQVENSWIKSPRRIIESVTFTQNLDKEYDGGIQILSNLNSPPFVDKTQNVWYTTQDKNENPSDDDDE
jgi:hypothetical protein